MKHPPTKAQVRDEIAKQVEEFLQNGGEVSEVTPGTSGLVNGELNSSNIGFERPRQPRTPVPDIVATIEAKKKAKLAKNQRKCSRARPRRPQKKVIYDDFGEPIRVLWQDE